jgi:processive 1,2-diacylglycerol beta-glucosyltransferase
MRLLIISTGAGTGHVQAAAALEEAARRDRPDVEVRNVDALDHGTQLLRDLYDRSYVLMANRIPRLWGFLYHRSETRRRRPPTARVLSFLDRHNARGLLSLVRRWRPDRIVTTHFLPASALSRYAEVPLDVVVTDFLLHTFWLQPRVRRYYVATEDAREALVRRGIPRERIGPHGIPVSGRFLRAPSRAEARRTLSLPEDAPVVLAMGGGFGRRGLPDVVAPALASSADVRVLAVAGRNEKMKAALARRFGESGRVRILGFVDDIEVLMAAADLVVTKPGGLTTSEALTVGRPLVLTAPVPGQEERNARWLTAAGAARTAVTAPDLDACLGELLGDREQLDAMASAARRAARPDAASRIVADVLAGVGGAGRRDFVASPRDAC